MTGADEPSRPFWLTTLADLGLLLVGFFVFLQANQQVDRAALASGFRAAFDAPPPPMAVAAAPVEGFTPGSARLPDIALAIGWAKDAARDPRTEITVTGNAGATRTDSDPATGSAQILAADRARAVAAALIASGAATPGQIRIATATGTPRVLLTLGFAGDRQ